MVGSSEGVKRSPIQKRGDKACGVMPNKFKRVGHREVVFEKKIQRKKEKRKTLAEIK